MAKQTITKLIDDLDGGVADETVKFGLDGSNYEIDLSEANASKLRQALMAYVAAATAVRHVGLHRVSPVASPGRKAENQKIREWAEAHGWDVSERGRISAAIQDAYRTGTPGPNYGATKSNEAQKAASVQNTSETAAVNGSKEVVDAETANDGDPSNDLVVSAISNPVFSASNEAVEPPKKATPRKRPAKAASPFSGKAVAAAAAKAPKAAPRKAAPKK